MSKFNLKVNGKKYEADVDPSTPVLWVLRDHLNLIGTKFGCGVVTIGASLEDFAADVRAI
jgi:aerobic-type carbon monoxide dehydrogenase small subunit (CoxS/CutS family)